MKSLKVRHIFVILSALILAIFGASIHYSEPTAANVSTWTALRNGLDRADDAPHILIFSDIFQDQMGASLYPPTVVNSAANITITRGPSANGSIIINSPPLDNVVIFVDGRLNLEDWADVSGRTITWNVEFRVRAGGTLVLGHNHMITRGVFVEPGGTFNNLHTGEIIRPEPPPAPEYFRITLNEILDDEIINSTYSSHRYGSDVVIQPPKLAEDAEFIGWTGFITSNEPILNFTMPNHDIVLNFHQNTKIRAPEYFELTINLVLDDEIIYTMSSEHRYGEEIQIEAPDPVENVEFLGWTGFIISDESILNFVMPNHDIVLNFNQRTVIPPPEYFEITLNLVLDGEIIYTTSSRHLYGDPIQIEAPTPAENVEFIGWTGFITSDEPILNFAMPNRDITLNINQITIPPPVEYFEITINLILDDEIIYTISSDHRYGEEIRIESPTPGENVEFLGWTGFIASDEPILNFAMPNRDITLNINQRTIPPAPEYFEITLNLILDDEIIYTMRSMHQYGEDIEIHSPTPGENIEFIGWTGFITTAEPDLSFTMPNHDITLNINQRTIPPAPEYFEITINFVLDDEIIHTTSSEHRYGEAVRIESPTLEENIEFLGWTGFIASDDPILNFTMPAKNVILYHNTKTIPPTPPDPQYRLFVASYLYGEHMGYLVPVVFVENGDYNREMPVNYNEFGIPFVWLAEGRLFWLNITIPDFYRLSGEDANYWIMDYMGAGDMRIRADFVGLYRAKIDEAEHIGAAGTYVELATEPREGYNFGGWRVLSGEISIDSPENLEANFVMPRGEFPGQIVAEISTIWTAIETERPPPPPPLPPLILPIRPILPPPTPRPPTIIQIPAHTPEPPRRAPSIPAAEIPSLAFTSVPQLFSVNMPDLPAESGYFPYILLVTSRNIFPGVSADNFAPNSPITRAMFVHILANLQPAENLPENSANFADIPQDSWYFNAVNWAVDLGLVSGMDDGNFAPYDAVSREQLALIVHRFIVTLDIEIPLSTEFAPFADQAQLAPWSRKPAIFLHQAGLLTTRQGHNFEPQSPATRAEAAVTIARLYLLMHENR
ncbi:MAG: S-layer homology domain-containing protein [Clostridiales bacterium]|jgi:hypothetical protein|nr:S-layer homology domain-containing protein [Clostridiales bacterium]